MARTIWRFISCFRLAFHWLPSFPIPVLGTSLFSPPFYWNYLQYTVFCAIMCSTIFFVVLVFALTHCCFFVYWILLLWWAYYKSIYLNCQGVNINFSKFVWLHKHDNLYLLRFNKKDVFPCFLKYGTSPPLFRIFKNFFKNFCKTHWQMRSMGV